jgi:23S rRNA pseudoU1915 N3-methylase RlmH
MGNASSMNKINFEDVQYSLNEKETILIINTLSENEQECIIPNTITPEKEINIINTLLRNGNKNIKIIIYGKNCNDDKMYKKYQQLQSLGFYNIYLYVGGLFEWLMLQDIYGEKEFPTSKKELDILKFKPQKKMNVHLLEY